MLSVYPDATIIRPSIMYGHEDRFLNWYAMWALEKGPVLLPDGGHARVQPVCVEDVALAYAKCLRAPHLTTGKTYNLAGREVYTQKEVRVGARPPSRHRPPALTPPAVPADRGVRLRHDPARAARAGRARQPHAPRGARARLHAGAVDDGRRGGAHAVRHHGGDRRARRPHARHRGPGGASRRAGSTTGAGQPLAPAPRARPRPAPPSQITPRDMETYAFNFLHRFRPGGHFLQTEAEYIPPASHDPKHRVH